MQFNFKFSPEVSYGSVKYWLISILYLSYYYSYWINFHMLSIWQIVCSLITFSILNSVWLVFCLLEFRSAAFCKNPLVFWFSHMITNFEFRIFVIISNTRVKIGTRLKIYRFPVFLVLECTHPLMLHSYICRLYSSKYWSFFWRQQNLLHCVSNKF